MVVFGWEQSVNDAFAKLPQDGDLFSFLKFMSYPGKLGWCFCAIVFIALTYRSLRERIDLLFAAGIAIGLSDLISRRIVKAFVLRPRPHFVHSFCEGSHCWGFVSSHATNITALATVFCLYRSRNLLWSLPVVLLVIISRIYLQDHYPLDVLGGTLLGFILGAVVWKIYDAVPRKFRSRKPALDSRQ